MRFGIVGSGKTGGEFEEKAFAGEFRGKLDVIKAMGLLGVLRGGGVGFFVGVGGDLFGIDGDEIFLDPGSALGFDAQIEEALLGSFDELFCFFGTWVEVRRLRIERERCWR